MLLMSDNYFFIMIKCYINKEEFKRLLKFGSVRLNSISDSSAWVNLGLAGDFTVDEVLSELKYENDKH